MYNYSYNNNNGQLKCRNSYRLSLTCFPQRVLSVLSTIIYLKAITIRMYLDI